MAGKPWRKRAKNWLIFHSIRSLLWLVRLLPRWLALSLFEKFGMIAFWLVRDARVKTLRHLNMAFGDKCSEAQIRQIAKESFRALGRNACEAMRLPQLIRDGLDRHVRFVGREHLDKAFARGKGVFCMTGHIGCWELLATFLAHNYPMAAVGATLYDPRLNEILLAERQRAGYRSFPRSAGGTREIIRWFRQGGLLGILIDQDTRVDGEFVDFLGHPAHTPAGIVVLAERTGAALMPMAIYMNPDRTHTLEVRPEVMLQSTGDARADRLANVLKCSKAVEAFIREHPMQWVWLHERWKTKAPAKNLVK